MQRIFDRYTEQAAKGRLTYQRCEACNAVQGFPRAFCCHCGAEELAWQDSDGHGAVAAVTILHRAPTPFYRERTPYCIVLVDLAEGFRVMGHGAPDLAIGDRVQAGFEVLEDRHLVRFDPV